MTDEDSLVLEDLGDGVRRLTLNRASRMNSLNGEVFRSLGVAAHQLSLDGTRALILTGAGERAFCAGYDLAEIGELQALSVRDFLTLEEMASSAIAAFHRLPFPVIAAVNGAAVGGGLSLALAADLRLAAPSASFSAAFARVGLSVGELGTSWTLSRVVGSGLAAEMAFTGRLVPAAEALRCGLVNAVVGPGTLQREAHELARVLASPERAGRIGKRTLVAREEVASYAAALQAELPDRP